MRRLDAEVLLDVRCDLGEGPIWHPGRAAVSWVELYEGRVSWLALDGTSTTPLEVGGLVGSAVPAADGRLLLGTDRGFLLAGDDGELELAGLPSAATSDWFVNDARCDAAGRLWAGTVGLDPETRLAVPGAGALFCLERDRTLTRVRDGITLSNGLDWSPDGGTLYYVDSFTWGVDAYPFDLENGRLGEPRRAVEIPRDEGFADGLCADADGCLWIAVWGAGEIRRYTPAGALDTVVALPVTQPTSCAFAGEDLDVLVITTARRHLDEARLREEPHAGSVFCCRPGPRGLPGHAWGDGLAGVA